MNVAVQRITMLAEQLKIKLVAVGYIDGVPKIIAS